MVGTARCGRLFLVSVCVAACLAGLVTRGNAGAAEVDPEFHIYLLIGQSNMAGRGKVDAESKKTHARVLMLTKDLKWEPATDPLHFDKPIAAVGPGLAFGKAMAEAAPKARIGLVPCAVGGSRIAEWEPSARNYGAMLKRTHEALNTGVLKGILWHQGESDVNSGASYGMQLTKLIQNLRRDLNAPNVPFVAGELTAFTEDDGPIGSFNAALHGVSGKVPNYAWVPAQGLKDKGDKVHYDTASARELGRRYAKKMLELQNGK